MKNTIKKILLALLAVGLVGCTAAPKPEETSAPEPEATEETTTETTTEEAGVKVAPTGTGLVVVKSSEWADKYKDQYTSYMANENNSEVVEYTEENPYIKDLYQGIGFAKSYASARGHSYVIDDLYSTGRPHKLANCFTCKNSEFTAKVLNEGEGVYAMAFEDFQNEYSGTDPFGCFHCHANDPAEGITITHGYMVDSMGEDLNKVSDITLSCGQCHTEYYFDPENSATKVAYTGLSKMGPDAELEYLNALTDKEGNLFADFVDEDTGTRKLKVQHPEFETYVSAGSIHYGMNMTCADCHMADAKNDAGESYTDHFWSVPTGNAAIEDKCMKCHSDIKALEEKIETIKTETTAREDELGQALVELDKNLAAKVAEGSLSEEDLEAARMADRNAQWYWDYVYVENSEGVHNQTLTKQCFEKCEKYMAEANEILGVQ